MNWMAGPIADALASTAWIIYIGLWVSCLPGYHGVTATDCAQGCQCMDGNSIYLCRHSNLTRIPRKLSPTAILLELDFNYIFEIRNNSLEKVPNVEIISLEYNRIAVIESGAFGESLQLRVLSLQGNHIGLLPKNVFMNNRNLEVLDLSHNDLYNIPHEAIFYLFNLQVLNISHNSIGSAFLGTGFRYTTHLRMLDLSANQIPSIEMDSFQATIWWDESVEHFLNLSYCNIRQVHKNAFKDLNHITGFSLQGNNDMSQSNLRTLLTDTPAMRLETLDLSNIGIPRLKNFFQEQKFDALKGLDISRNKIKEIDGGTFTFMENLLRLDLSFNRISMIKTLNGLVSLEVLNLSHNRLSKINMTTFDGLQNLKTLYLAFNNLTSLSGEPFQNLWFLETWDISHNHLTAFDVGLGFEHLKHLSVSNNHLSQLNFIRKLPRVQHIDISGNQVNSIHVDIFGKGQLVRIFNASYNSISQVEPLSFHPSSLQVIDLRHNHLKQLTHFGWTSTLKELYLGYNNISYLAPNSFEGLTALELLDLSYCGLYSFPKETFTDFYQLKKLDISYNPLGKFLVSDDTNTIFQNLEKLEEVDLSLTSLHEFPSRLFANRITLHSIDLRGNHISSLLSDAFRGLPNIRRVYLSDNKLTSINSMAFSYLTSLETLDLSHNPFQCSCDFAGDCDWLMGTYVEVLNFKSGDWTCSNENIPEGGGTMDNLPLYTYCSSLARSCDTFSHDQPKTIFWLVAAAILFIICIVIVIVVYKVCSRDRKKKSQKMLAKIAKDLEHEQEKMIIENLKYKCNNVTNIKEDKL